MKAIRINQFGDAASLTYTDVPVPQPKEGEVLIKMVAAGVNFIDVYHRIGRYPMQLPFTLGGEGAGVIEAVAAGVKGFKKGDRVAFTGVQGSYAEYIAAPAARIVKIPKGVETKIAAALMTQGMTAHYLVKDSYKIKKGDVALIHAAAGGTGLLLTQAAKKFGAFVIATVGSEEKAKLARGAGADEVIIYTKQDFEAEVKRLTNNTGVHVVYDSVGKDTFEKSLNCLRQRGMMVLFGSASGPAPMVDPNALGAVRGSLFLTRPFLYHYIPDRESLVARAKEVFRWVANKQLKVRIGATYKLADAAQAHRDLESRATTGKLLIVP